MITMKLLAISILLLGACGDDGGETLSDARVVNDAELVACTDPFTMSRGARCEVECADRALPPASVGDFCSARYVHDMMEVTRNCSEEGAFTAGGKTGCCFMEGSAEDGYIVHFAICD